MNGMSILYQLKKAGYHIVRLFPPKVRRLVTPFFSIIGLIGFMRFMIFWGKSPMLIKINDAINNYVALLFSTVSNFSWGILFVIAIVYVLIRQKIMWRLISWLYVIVLVLGILPFLKEVIKW